jgi:hypothetical protein
MSRVCLVRCRLPTLLGVAAALAGVSAMPLSALVSHGAPTALGDL